MGENDIDLRTKAGAGGKKSRMSDFFSGSSPRQVSPSAEDVKQDVHSDAKKSFEIRIKIPANFYKLGFFAVIAAAVIFGGYWFLSVRGERTSVEESRGGEIENGTPVPALPLKDSYKVKQPFGGGAEEKITIEEPAKLPDAKKFASFYYEPASGKTTTISGVCNDVYYALLIFNARDDYKKDPAAARVNRAYNCPPEKRFSQTLNFREFNLPAGTYYFFVADQGKQGPWYNPR